MTVSLTRNIALKVLSLALAIALWSVVAREETTEAVFRTDIEFANVPPTLEITGDPPSKVELRIRASSTTMTKLKEMGIVARVDLRNANAGQRQIMLGADNFDLPFGCQVVRLTPSEVRLELEEKEVRWVLVSPRLEGRVAEGYQVVSLAAGPERVQIEGPRSRVRRLNAVTTEPVSIEGLVTSLSQRAALRVPDPVCRVLGDSGVQLDVTITEIEETRALDGVLVETVPPSGAVVTPARVRVELRGPASRIRFLKATDMRARIDLSGLAAGSHRLVPAIVFSTVGNEKIQIVSVTPERVAATISK